MPDDFLSQLFRPVLVSMNPIEARFVIFDGNQGLLHWTTSKQTCLSPRQGCTVSTDAVDPLVLGFTGGYRLH